MNAQEMVVIHRVFRRELAALPALVRATAPGDAARARTVGAHVELVLGFLHAHHSGEDELLWPRLLQRAAPSAGLIATMQAQHERVESLTAATAAAATAWTASATAESAGRLAADLDRLREALVEHLDLEEREIVPLIEAHISAAEWAQLAEHGKNATPRRHLPLVFGAMLEDATPSERTTLLASVPAPVRFFLRTAGSRQYRRYTTRVRELTRTRHG